MRCATVFRQLREPINDADTIRFQEIFQLASLKRVGGETVLDAIAVYGVACAYPGSRL
jgi:hypothetical protein